jgi:hypothetical protein
MNMTVQTEPALVTALVQASIALVVSFGLNLSPEQVGGLLALTAAATAVFLRRQVTPVPSAPEPAANPQPASPQIADA